MQVTGVHVPRSFEADGEIIEVESPAYAAPCLAYLDGDCRIGCGKLQTDLSAEEKAYHRFHVRTGHVWLYLQN